jgi:hypothetical protein
MTLPHDDKDPLGLPIIGKPTAGGAGGPVAGGAGAGGPVATASGFEVAQYGAGGAVVGGVIGGVIGSLIFPGIGSVVGGLLGAATAGAAAAVSKSSDIFGHQPTQDITEDPPDVDD